MECGGTTPPLTSRHVGSPKRAPPLGSAPSAIKFYLRNYRPWLRSSATMRRTPLRTFGTWFSSALASLVFSAAPVAAESPADLVALGLAETPLSPDFDRETSLYTAQVPHATSTVTLSGSAAGPDTATILTRLNGAPPVVGLPREIPLRPGLNRVSLSVTADGAPLRDLAFAAGSSRFLAVHPDGHLMQAPLSGSGTLPTLPPEVQSGVVGVIADGGNIYVRKSDGSIFTLGGYAAPAALGAGQAGVTQPRVVSAAAGAQINIALREDGTVLTWPATLATDARDIVSVAAGRDHVLTLDRQGRVCAYGGSNGYGQLNVPADAQAGIVAIAAGPTRNLALRADGRLVQWGASSTALAAIPEAAIDVVSIGLTAGANIARTRTGSLVTWGAGFAPPPDAAGRVVAQLANAGLIMALLDDGSLIHWGISGSATAIAGFEPLFTPPVCNYELTVERTPASAALASLTIGGGALTPSFDPDALSYSASLPYSAKTLDLATTLAAPDTATLRTRIDGAPSRPGLPTGIPLQIGTNLVELRVTADGQTLRDFPIAANGTRCLAVSADGALMQLPNNSSSPALPAETASGVEGVFSGPFGDYALKTDGRLVRLSGAAVPDDAQPTAAGVEPARAPGVALAVGGSHALLLRADGTTFVWASGGTNPTLNIPEEARSGVVAVAASTNNCTALKADGTVVEWGGYFTGTWTNWTTRIVAISASATDAPGGGSLFTLTTDGRIFAIRDYSLDATLAQVPTPFVSIAAVGSAVYGLTAEGGVHAWKSGSSTPLTTPTALQSGVVAIHGSPNHLLAIKTDGTVETWPASTSTPPLQTSFARPLTEASVRVYRLGVERRTPDDALAHLTPLTPAAGPAGPDFDPETLNYTIPDSTPATAATINGLPFAGQPRLEVQVNNGPRLPVVAGKTLATQGGSGIAIRDDGSVFGWGSVADVPPAASADVVSVAMAKDHAVALKADGTVVEWGSTPESWLPLPTHMKVVAITAGDRFVAAILPNGLPYVWGDTSALHYIRRSPDARDLVAIEASSSHLLVLRRDGRAIDWGHAYIANEKLALAVPADAQSNVVAIAAGPEVNFALRGDGRLISWGPAVGAGTAYDLRLPPLVHDDVVGIAANPIQRRFAALKSDGEVVTWSSYPDGTWSYYPYGPNLIEARDAISVTADSHNALAQGADGKFGVMPAAISAYPAELFTQSFALPLNVRLPLQTGANTLVLHATPRDTPSAPGQAYTYSLTRRSAPKSQLIRTDPTPDEIVPAGLAVTRFGPARVGLGASQSWILRNIGDAPLNIDSMTFAQLPPDVFSVSGIALPLTLPPGGEAPFAVTAIPVDTRTTQGDLTIHSDQPFASQRSLRFDVRGVTATRWLSSIRAHYFSDTERNNPALEADLWGNLADPDGDGLPNLLEYAAANSPKVAGSGRIGALSLEPADEELGTPRRLTLTYTRPIDARVAGVVFATEWSDELSPGEWFTHGVTEEIKSTDSNAGTERVVASVPLPGDSARRFLRLRVTLPEAATP